MARAMCAPCADRTRANGEVGVAPNRHVRTATQAKQQHATEKKPELKNSRTTKKVTSKKGHIEKRSHRKGQGGVLVGTRRHFSSKIWTCPCWPEGMRATPTRFLKVSRRPPAAPEATSAGLKRGSYPEMRRGRKPPKSTPRNDDRVEGAGQLRASRAAGYGLVWAGRASWGYFRQLRTKKNLYLYFFISAATLLLLVNSFMILCNLIWAPFDSTFHFL